MPTKSMKHKRTYYKGWILCISFFQFWKINLISAVSWIKFSFISSSFKFIYVGNLSFSHLLIIIRMQIQHIQNIVQTLEQWVSIHSNRSSQERYWSISLIFRGQICVLCLILLTYVADIVYPSSMHCLPYCRIAFIILLSVKIVFWSILGSILPLIMPK